MTNFSDENQVKRKNDICSLSDDELVAKHQGLAHKVVNDTVWQYFDPMIEHDDLVQIGLLKLIELKESYDGSTEFSTFAYHCIKNAIRKTVIHSISKMNEREKVGLDCVDKLSAYEDSEKWAIDDIIADIKNRATEANRRNIEYYFRRVTGESIEDISNSTGLNCGYVRTLINRGKNYLASQTILREAYELIA